MSSPYKTGFTGEKENKQMTDLDINTVDRISRRLYDIRYDAFEISHRIEHYGSIKITRDVESVEKMLRQLDKYKQVIVNMGAICDENGDFRISKKECIKGFEQARLDFLVNNDLVQLPTVYITPPSETESPPLLAFEKSDLVSDKSLDVERSRFQWNGEIEEDDSSLALESPTPAGNQSSARMSLQNIGKDQKQRQVQEVISSMRFSSSAELLESTSKALEMLGNNSVISGEDLSPLLKAMSSFLTGIVENHPNDNPREPHDRSGEPNDRPAQPSDTPGELTDNENDYEPYDEMDKNEQTIKQLNEEISQLQYDYKSLTESLDRPLPAKSRLDLEQIAQIYRYKHEKGKDKREDLQFIAQFQKLEIEKLRKINQMHGQLIGDMIDTDEAQLESDITLSRVPKLSAVALAVLACIKLKKRLDMSERRHLQLKYVLLKGDGGVEGV